jgi:hypothetical protein
MLIVGMAGEGKTVIVTGEEAVCPQLSEADTRKFPAVEVLMLAPV